MNGRFWPNSDGRRTIRNDNLVRVIHKGKSRDDPIQQLRSFELREGG